MKHRRRTRSAGATSSARSRTQTPVALTYDTGNYDADARRGAEDRRRRGLPGAQGRSGEARQAARHRLSRRTSRPAASRRRTSRARSARAPACSRRARCACIRPAASRSSPARTATARATRRRSRRSSPARLGIADRQRRRRARRHRPHPVRHGHLRLALAGGRRHGDREGARQGRSPRARRSPRTCSRPPKPTSSSRTASSPSPAPTAARRSREVALAAYVPHNYPLDKLEPGLDETAFYDPTNFTYPGGHAHLRGRDRSGDRRRAGRELHRVRRFRQHHQSDDRRGPGARRPRAGHRPGAARELRLRPGERAAADRQLHGLRDAARRRPAVVQGGHQGHAVHAQSARREGLRRGGRDRRAGRDDERRPRRARRRRRHPHRHAGLAAPRVAGDPVGQTVRTA